MIKTRCETERHKDDIADGIRARQRMLTSEKTGGIIFFGLSESGEGKQDIFHKSPDQKQPVATSAERVGRDATGNRKE